MLQEFEAVETTQKALSIEGQIEELHQIVKEPAILIGHSWGAFLSILFAEKYPDLVKKLILIGCPSFDQKEAEGIMERRFTRLSETEVDQLNSYMTDLEHHFEEAALLIGKADSYDPMPKSNSPFRASYETFKNIQPEIKKLRQSGQLLEAVKKIHCPIIVIQGTYDPHIFDIPQGIPTLELIVLPKCGHSPWTEKQAQTEFLEILTRKLRETY